MESQATNGHHASGVMVSCLDTISFNNTLTTCGLAAAQLAPQSLFDHLAPNCQPKAEKAGRYLAQDQLFIWAEIQVLLSEGIIESLKSSWRTQVLVTSNERHKKRKVIDHN